MSIKTLRKHISLVAVSALGAGLISLVPISQAQASAGGTNSAAAVDRLQIATQASTTGSAVVSGTETGAANRSTGLIYESNASGATGGTTQTAVMLTGGTLVFYTGDNTGTSAAFVAEGGKFSSMTNGTYAELQTGFATKTINAGRTTAFWTGATTYAAVAFAPDSGVSTATVYLYTGNSTTATSPTLGTLSGKVVITVTSTNVAGSYSPVYSTVAFDDADITSPSSQADSVDDGTYVANGGYGYIGVNLLDAFASTLGAGVLTASATNGVVCDWEANPTAVSTSNPVYTSASYATLHCAQGAVNKNKPVTTTVTINWNGTVVGSKSIRFHGTATKISVYDDIISNLGTAPTTGNTGAKFKVLDSAGNWINEETAVSVSSTSVDGAVVTGASVATASDPDTPQVGYVKWNCNAVKGGTGKFTVLTYDANQTKISADVTARCGGDIDTFTVSTDKAVYAPGEIISVTITAKDENGDLANSKQAMTPVNVLASGAFASTVDTPTTADTLTNGKVVYRFIATQTSGTYSISVSVPVNGSEQAATTTSVTVKGATTTTNEDVLKSIVALIASINKQIQALQKLILKR